MTLESTLMSVPVENWRSAKVMVFDYHDGPRAGVCILAEPQCDFYFELLDERRVEDDLDDRLFRLSTLPAGMADRLAAGWQFDSVEAREQARRLADEVQAA